MQAAALAVGLCAVALRQAVSLHPHSGQGKPPMFGDYEAQRHWLEITSNLPVGEWYRQGPDNDLQYWGLDYPPLTAYTSWAFGKAAHVLEPESVALFASRGYESATSKAFMRGSVLLLDVLVFFPALWLALGRLYPAQQDRRLATWALSLALPALVLIDYGHFQYNTASLGLALWALLCVLDGRDVLASVFFCLSLNFKQMSLYLAPGFFFVLLRRCVDSPAPVRHFVSLGVAVVATFAACWAPFCLSAAADETCGQGLMHVVERLFPVGRGLYEDKVANVWFATTVVFKWKDRFERGALVLAALAATLCALLPSGATCLLRPSSANGVVLALFNSAMAFFLFSYQVHEKSLLLAAVPAMLLAGREPVLACWFGAMATFTMYPLLARDELRLAYAATMLLFAAAALGCVRRFGSSRRRRHGRFVALSLLGCAALHAFTALVEPPARYPDLQAVLFSIYGAGNLGLAWVQGLAWQMWEPAWWSASRGTAGRGKAGRGKAGRGKAKRA